MSKRVPKLRFKEFKSDGEWEEKRLGDIANITTGSSNREDSTQDKGQYTFFDRSEDIRTSHKFLFDDEAIIVAGEGSEFKPKYFNGKFDLHQRTYAILELQIIGKFLYYYIFRFRNYFIRYAVGSTVKSLRQPIFEQMPIFLPTIPEQQKIANTLSSLDNLIISEDKKLQALQTYKKGLMQQLFPKEGERVPKLRFKEFKSNGEWKEKKLYQFIEDFIVPMRDKPKDLTGNIPWCRIEDFDGMYLSKSKTNQGVTKETIKKMNLKIYPKNTLLVSCSADLGRCAIVKNELVTNQTFIGLVSQNDYDVRFLYYLMSNSKNKLNTLSTGTTISYLPRNEFENFEVKIPLLEEQQKIANTLSSLDNLIEEQSKKIETLKEHKKGLMQKMFVSEDS
jgi:type I restriction enzyme S subunit